MAAPTVEDMSSCRATSFYLAPGVMRYFRDHTLAAVLPDGTWVEITHRADIARLRHEHPEWDGTVLCSRVKLETVQQLRELLLDDPAKIERWNIDPRVIEGRRPEGPQFVLHRMVWNGVEAVGGTRQIIDAVLPGCNKTLRRAAEALILEHGETAALRLSVTCAMRGVVSDDELAAMLTEPSVYELQPWLGVEIDRFRENFLRATEHAPHRRAALIRNLLSGETLTDSEIVTAIDKADRISPALAEKLLRIDRPSLRDLVVDIACLPGLSTIQHLEILCGEERNAVHNLAQNIELKPETVEAAWRRGAELRDIYNRLPLTDAMFSELLEEGLDTAALGANALLSERQLQRVLERALTGTQGAALHNLARNRNAGDAIRIELIQATLGSSVGETVRNALARNNANSTAVCQALLAANDAEACRVMVREHSRLDGAVLRAVCDVQDATAQALAVTELLQRGDIGLVEELKLVETCDIATWPRFVTHCRHTATLERILYKAHELRDAPTVRELAVARLDRQEVRITENDLTTGGIAELLTSNRTGAVTTDLLNRLVKHENGMVALSALYANGARVDEDVRIHTALHHPEGYVRGAAYKTRERLEGLQRTALCELPVDNAERRWMVTEASLSDATQRAIVDQGHLSELIALGHNKGVLNDETLMVLMAHQSPNVRRAAAGRRDLQGYALLAAETDPDDQTREAALIKGYGVLYDERGERIKRADGEDSELQQRQGRRDTGGSAATTTQVVVDGAQQVRVENRDTRDIHVITSRRADTTLIRSHHPIEYTVEPAAVLRESIEHGAENRERIFPDDVRDVRRLPDWGSLPFRSVEPAVQAIDGYKCSVVAHDLLDARRRTGSTPSDSNEPESVALVARVLDSRRAIEHNAEYMGNCTAGYTSAVGRGEVQLVALDDENGQCMLNVELKWDTREIRWVPGEINTRFNGYGYGYESTPESVKSIADQLAERLNNTGATP
jgi:hypothetical protein